MQKIPFFVIPAILFAFVWIIAWGIYLCFNKKENLSKKKEYSSKKAVSKEYILPANAVFKDISRLTKRLNVLLFIIVFSSLSSLVYSSYPVFFQSFYANTSHKIAVALFVFLFSITCIFCILIEIVFMFIWLYKATFNAHYLKAQGLVYSPKGAILWSLLPFGIYFVVRDIWKASCNPERPLKSLPNPTFVKIWYILFCISFIFVRISLTRINEPVGILDSLGALANIAETLSFIFIINKVHKEQISRYNPSSSQTEALAESPV